MALELIAIVPVRQSQGSPFACRFDSRPPVIRGGQVFGFNGLHVFNGHQLPAEPTGSPMDPPDNSSFDEVTSTRAVGRDVDRFETPASTRTEKTHGTWGSIAITGAKGLADTSLGSHAESTPPE